MLITPHIATALRAALAALAGAALVVASGDDASTPASSAEPAAGAPYLGTLPSGASGLPRDDASCALLVAPNAWEPHPENSPANAVVPPPGAASWANTRAQTYWRRWIAKRNLVTGDYSGTTDQILRWGACKWGIDDDTIRAVAVQESDWDQSTVGDQGQSFGIMQIKDHYSDGTPAWGGYPWTQRATALNVDFYGAAIRSCLNGDFYDGGSWLYRGRTIQEVIAQHGEGYALWGCIGWWFSGGWYDASSINYINHVKSLLAEKAWRSAY
jgi:hypothetical protein